MYVGSGILLTIIVVWITWYAHDVYSKALQRTSIPVREYSQSNNLTNPLLYTDDLSLASPNLDSLKKSIASIVKQNIDHKSADSVSVYFRDLINSEWTGVNEQGVYKPSSMYKILVMMNYLSGADQNPSLLQKKLLYTAKTDQGQYYKPEHVLSNGNHSVQELINSMIIYSDNDAANALVANDPNGYVNLFTILKLPLPKDSASPDFISPKSYSVILRTLYNGTYLTHFLSESALGLLTSTKFDGGIVSGIPKGITVAHKFGEYTNIARDQSVVWKELHDCGIVYYPNHPFLLCIMTKGQEFNQLEDVISAISSKAYASVDERVKSKL